MADQNVILGKVQALAATFLNHFPATGRENGARVPFRKVVEGLTRPLT